MKAFRTPVIWLILLYAVFFCCLAFTARQLPERVASHFGADGQADGWMNRSAYLQFISIFGSIVPLFIIVVFRSLPVNLINVPNHDFWFAPERCAQSHAYIFRQSFWFASLMIGLFTGVHLAIIQANDQSSARLSLLALSGVLGIFMIGILAWATNLFRHFSRTN